eukprot:CAMPEP_0177648900 /NCGR_PEP_ID=MMETSP0447-20121125/11080_1 /TAXON_ID=0 /ORGANISM="Stygamoeba regulata, Strain BSH-02190019" /LENGTH=320 /DNA_ID=CAMNT_0019151583 /DNA_START=113 /DNA_END=1075 /DNA_ORIENTATION=+
MAQFGYRTKALDVVRELKTNLAGKVAIVTGGYGGIGLETSKALSAAGALVVVAGRNPDTGKQAVEEINAQSPTKNTEFLHLDLSSLESVRKSAEEFKARHQQLHILVNNAGIMACPFTKTVDGFESQFATNHLGPFLFTTLLMPVLLASAPARIVNLSSIGHKRSPVLVDDPNFETTPYDKWTSYGSAKCAAIWFSLELHARFGSKGITANAVHPGGIATGLQKHMTMEEMTAMGWYDKDGKLNERFKTVEEGAATTVWAAVAPELEGDGGHYCEDCHIGVLGGEGYAGGGHAPYALDAVGAKKLWTISEEMVGHKCVSA